MSRIVPAEEFDLIEQAISEFPEGIGISALEKAPGFGRLFPSPAAKSFRHLRPLRAGVFRDGTVALSATL
jgi:hypothetical protein